MRMEYIFVQQKRCLYDRFSFPVYYGYVPGIFDNFNFFTLGIFTYKIPQMLTWSDFLLALIRFKAFAPIICFANIHEFHGCMHSKSFEIIKMKIRDWKKEFF